MLQTAPSLGTSSRAHGLEEEGKGKSASMNDTRRGVGGQLLENGRLLTEKNSSLGWGVAESIRNRQNVKLSLIFTFGNFGDLSFKPQHLRIEKHRVLVYKLN